MTFAVAHSTQAPLGAVAILRVVDTVLNAKETIVTWNNARLTRNALSCLSAEQLRDIGLTRDDII
jgi:uncharacterized protein YjiS (DUF1127 family)